MRRDSTRWTWNHLWVAIFRCDTLRGTCSGFLEKHNHDFLSWSKCHIFLRSPLVRDHFGTLFGSRLSSVAELRQKIKMADFAFFPIFETKNCSGAELRGAEKNVSKPKILPRKCRLCCQQKFWENVNKQLIYDTKRKKHVFSDNSQVDRNSGMLCPSNESLCKTPSFKGLSSLGQPWDGAPGPQIGPLARNCSAQSQRPLAVILIKQKLSGLKSSVENCPRTWRLINICQSYGQNSKPINPEKCSRPFFMASEAWDRPGNVSIDFLARF